jgi:hypothetical protein
LVTRRVLEIPCGCELFDRSDVGKDVHEIHMEAEVQIGISNIAAVTNIYDVPQRSIKCRADVAK